MKIATVILSIGLSTGAIWYDSEVCASVMLFVAVFVRQGEQGRKTTGLRKLIIRAAYYELVCKNVPINAGCMVDLLKPSS